MPALEGHHEPASEIFGRQKRRPIHGGVLKSHVGNDHARVCAFGHPLCEPVTAPVSAQQQREVPLLLALTVYHPDTANGAAALWVNAVRHETIAPPVAQPEIFCVFKLAANAVFEVKPEVVCEGRSLPFVAAPQGQPPIAEGDQRERS